MQLSVDKGIVSYWQQGPAADAANSRTDRQRVKFKQASANNLNLLLFKQIFYP